MKLPGTFSGKKNHINVMIETPAGSRNKYTYNKEGKYFEIRKILPAGTAFPMDFGFIPGTKGEDGDPLDILVIMDAPAYPGCVAECRLIGVIIAEQTEDNGEKIRNDRLVGVAAQSQSYSNMDSINDINKNLLTETVNFFKYYNKMGGKEFRLLNVKGKAAAAGLVKKHLIKPK